jgi:hypothetical protein
MLTWWMRIVGGFYVLLFVMCAIVKAPIRAEGPDGVLALAAAGDAVARFVVDTWVTYGLYLGAAGAVLLIASRGVPPPRSLVGMIVGLELAGIAADFYKLARGTEPLVPATWVAIHTLVILTGWWAMRRGVARSCESRSLEHASGLP